MGRREMGSRRRVTTVLLLAACTAVVAAGTLTAVRLFADKSALRDDVRDRIADWTGGQVTLSGPVQVSVFPAFTLEFGTLQVGSAERLPLVASLTAGAVRVELSAGSLLLGVPRIKRLELRRPHIVLASASGAADNAAAEPPLLRLLTTAPMAELVLSDGVIAAPGASAADRMVEVGATIEIKSRGASAGEGSFLWRGERIVVKYASDRPAMVAGAVQAPLRATVTSPLLSAQIEGLAAVGSSTQLRGTITTAAPRPTALARWLGLPLPAKAALGEMRATGGFNWAGQRIAFDQGTFSLDGNTANGSLTLSYAGGRPAISGTLAMQVLDLNRYLARPAGGAVPVPADVRSRLALLREIDLDLRVSTSRVEVKPLSLGQTALTIGLENGVLAADAAVLTVCGGRAHARLEANIAGKEPRWRLTGATSGIAVKPCAEHFVAPSLLAGTATVTLDLHSQGITPDGLIANLGGTADLALTAGQADIDLAKIVSQARKGALRGWASVRGSPTPFETLAARCTAARGVATCGDLDVRTGASRITGGGTIDLSTRRLDWHLYLGNELVGRMPQVQRLVSRFVEAVVVQGSWFEPIFDLAGHNSGRIETPGAPTAPRRVGHAAAPLPRQQ